MGVNYLIVISILEGKNFPVRHDKSLVVEAKFDGEVMSTDPVSHVTLPDFNTELAWEVDKKGLQMHRLQRTPIKLLWYAVDLELTRKEAIGYIILDMRLAQEKAQNPKWLPLLNSKYPKEKPEVLISLFLEKETIQAELSAQKGNSVNVSKTNAINEEKSGRKKHSNSSIPRQAQVIPKESLPPPPVTVLKPVLLPDASCYQIGPSEKCRENFTFSVTIAFAANLNKLTPPAMLRSPKGFYFYYSLFENDVTTANFANLSNPDFLAERASVRLSSSTDLLSVFFEQHQFLEILLCSGDVSLGSGHIPLGPLASVNRHNMDEEPLVIEGSVQITPIEKTSKFDREDLSPFIGVTVVLQKDKVEEEKVGKPTPPDTVPKNAAKNHQQPYQIVPQKSVDCPRTAEDPQENSAKQTGVPNHVIQDQTDRKTELPPHQSVNNRTQKQPSDTRVLMRPHSTDNSPNSVVRNINGYPTTELLAVDNVPHHFCFTVDLCNFKATQVTQPISLSIRYSYPFFGSSASISTHPEVEVLPKSEVSIPHGYCAFNFATTFGLLKSTFCDSPLILEAVNKKKQGSRQEQLIGTCRINLFQVLDAAPLPHISDKKQGTRRMSTCKILVISPDGHGIGELYAVLTLDDLGPTTNGCDKHSNKLTNSNIPQLRTSISSFDFPSLRQNGLTQEELIQAAFELEMWQERQRELFRAQLKDKEMQHLRVLVSEWKQRDTEREMLLQRKLQECQKLEDKLKQTLQDAEIKEKQLAAQEAELAHRLRNMEKQQEQQEKEARNHVEKIKKEYEEMLRIEKYNHLDLEQKNSTLQRKLQDQEAELQELKNVIDALKTQVIKQPDVQLKTEVNILNMEKMELQNKLEVIATSKQKYKNQWGEAVRLISVLQQKLHLMERLQLTKKDEELATLQQRILVAEEKNVVQLNQETVAKDKENVDSLRSVVSPDNGKPHEAKSHTAADFANAPFSSAESFPPKNGETKERSLHVRQLMAQKEKLLGTGMYTEEDQIIKQLTVHIQKA